VDLHREGKAFSALLLELIGGKPIIHDFTGLADIPAMTDEAVAASKALKKMGYTFIGPTIIYAHLQATGLVNDHLVDCFVRKEIGRNGGNR
jgi:DNA-3-methyladenine glycosylase I